MKSSKGSRKKDCSPTSITCNKSPRITRLQPKNFPDEDAERLRQALDVTVAWTTWDQIACVVQECANGFDSADESWPSSIHRPTAVVYRNFEKRTKSESPFQDSITR
jgi:hypothetical protein